MAGQPAVNRGRLVRAGVVDNQMDVKGRGHASIDRGQELTKLAGALPLVERPDDVPRLGIERGEQRRRPRPRIVVRSSLRLARAQRQHGLTAVEGLNRRLLIDAQHQGCVGRMEVQPHDVAHLLDEQRILRELEGLGPVRLQGERPPDATDRGLAEPAAPRHGARTPVRGGARLRFQGQPDDALDVLIRDRARRAGTRLIQQAGQALGDEAPAPAAHRQAGHPRVHRDDGVRLSRRTRQHDPRPLRERLCRGRTPRPALQGLVFFRGEGQWTLRAASAHGRPPCLHGERPMTPFSFITSNSGH